MKQHSILFVDDDEFIRKIYTDRLEASGYKLVTASTAHEAKEKLELSSFDLVCLDHMLGDEPGIEVLKWMRTQKKINTPVIAFSASGHETNMKEYIAAGATEFVQKDHIMPSEFVKKIEDIIKSNDHE